MCTVLPLKQDYSGKNIAAKKRTRPDAFNKNTTIDSIAARDIAADEMLPMVPLMKRPRSCFHQTTATTSTTTTAAATTPPTRTVPVPTKIHIIPQKTVMFADQMEQHQHEDEDEDDSSSSSSNEEDDDSVISIIDSVLGFAGDVPSTDAATTDAAAEQKEDVNVDDHDDHRDTWYHREELRAFQVEARNEVLADLARRVADHKSRKNSSTSSSTTPTHASSKSNKLKNLLKAATSTTATAAATSTTTTRGLERFDLFRAREKAAARKIVLLAYQQKMGGDQIASIAKQCSDRAVKQAITLARQDFNEVYPNNCK